MPQYVKVDIKIFRSFKYSYKILDRFNQPKNSFRYISNDLEYRRKKSGIKIAFKNKLYLQVLQTDLSS